MSIISNFENIARIVAKLRRWQIWTIQLGESKIHCNPASSVTPAIIRQASTLPTKAEIGQPTMPRVSSCRQDGPF